MDRDTIERVARAMSEVLRERYGGDTEAWHRLSFWADIALTALNRAGYRLVEADTAERPE